MHTDLREQLRGLGRTELLEAVNTHALAYYARQSAELTPAQSAQRAQILQAIGEDAENHNRNDSARRLFREAWATTAALLSDAPNDLERMFNHAQSEYWLGYDDYQRGQIVSARAHFLAYLALAKRMLAQSPNDARYWRELSYAEGNLCSVALKSSQNPSATIKLCTDALIHMKRAAKQYPRLRGIDVDLSDKVSWVGSAYQASGDDRHALKYWNWQQSILDVLLKRDPLNVDRRSEWVALQRNFARSEFRTGHTDRARDRLRRAVAVLEEILLLDPTNAFWTHQSHKLTEELRKLDQIN